MNTNKEQNIVWRKPKSLKLNFFLALVVTLIIMLFSVNSPVYATGIATVTSTLPTSGQSQVDPESVIKVTFDQAMNSATITSTNIILKDSTQQAVSLLSIFYDPTNKTAVITPAVPLKLSTDYQVVITTGVQDSSNTPLAQDYTWSFSTAAISTHPASGQSQVDPEGAIYVTFDQAMNPLTFTQGTCILKDSAQQIVSLLSIHYDETNNTAVLIPLTPLKLSTDYQAVITTGVQYSNNTPLSQDYTWSFKTAGSLQTTIPSVVFTIPLPGDSMVGLSQPIQVNFNHSMNSSTINSSTFILKDSTGASVPAQSILFDSTTRNATFKPAASLKNNETYQVTISQNVKDINGKPITQDYNWSFTTGSTPYFNPHGNYISNSTGCKSCHQTHTAEGKGLLNKSTQTQVCYTCHDGSGSITNVKQMMNQTGASQSYHPIMDTGNPDVPSTMQCTDCHNPHGDKDGQGQYYPNLLRATDGTTTAYQGVDFCIVCHSAKDPKGWDKSAYKSSIHAANGLDCSSCHASHTSANPSLNVQPINNQCLSCHPTAQTDFSQTYRHQAECANCHDPHTLTPGNITVSVGNDLCFKCHATAQYGIPSQPDNTTSGFADTSLPNLNLHNFSGSSGGHLGLTCSSCHVSVAHGYFRKGLVGSTGDGSPSVGTNNLISAIDSGVETSQWKHSSCTTSCHQPEPAPEAVPAPAPAPDSGA